MQARARLDKAAADKAAADKAAADKVSIAVHSVHMHCRVPLLDSLSTTFCFHCAMAGPLR